MKSNLEQQMRDELGENFGSLVATRKKENPYLATSKDGLNQAFGKSKEAALHNLIVGIAERAKL